MRKKRLLWQLYPSYMCIIFISLFAVTMYMSSALREFYLDKTAESLYSRAKLIEQAVSPVWGVQNQLQINQLCNKLGKVSSARVTIIAVDGTVIGDSEENPFNMDNHADRPEIKEAFQGSRGESTRFSYTLSEDFMYVAVPLAKNGILIGAVRTSLPVSSLDNTLRSIYIKIALGGVVIVLFSAALSWLLSRRIITPIEEMKRGAQRFARGDLNFHIRILDTGEIGTLADTLNNMARQLRDRIEIVECQRNELQAVLASMVEGVIAVDNNEHIISINHAAEQLIKTDRQSIKGKSIQEAVRNTALQRFVKKALSSTIPVEEDIIIHDNEDKYLQVHGTTLRDAQNNTIGALVVFDDVTRLRKLENLRSEFVANVSHEIKTPITSIKGFVETLLEGAINNPKHAKRFLGIIEKQTNRLNEIVEDLLSLSAIEESAKGEGIKLDRQEIRPVLQSALDLCSVKAEEKNIPCELICPRSLFAMINPPLLEQAIVNLISNAVKFSDEGASIQVESFENDVFVVVSVRDNGCGIDREHLPRLFERFYRVDKARNTKLGGTGLGLAIVKHIAQAHGGHVTVESTVGKGSIFSIYLLKA